MASAFASSSLYPPTASSSSNHTTPHPSPRSGGILLNPLTPLSSKNQQRPRHGSCLPDYHPPHQHQHPSPYSSAPNSPYKRSMTLPLPLPRTGSDASSSNNSGGESGSGGSNNNNNSGTGSHPMNAATSHSRQGSVRKIRFAPLPDPRREDELALMMMTSADSPLAIANGSLLFSANNNTINNNNTTSVDGGVQAQETSATDTTTPTTTSTATPSAPNTASLVAADNQASEPVASVAPINTSSTTSTRTSVGEKANGPPSSIASAEDGNPYQTDSEYGGAGGNQSRPHTPTMANSKGPTPKAGRWSKLFRPLLGGSSKMEGGRGAYSDEDGPNGGGGGFGALFRTESRDSMQSTTSEGGGAFGFGGASGVKRRTSVSSSRLSGTFGRTDSVPLARAQSLQTGSGSAATGGGRRKANQQQRMLNGRVYGARSAAMRKAFANVQDWEPEFVEWGHGGAGSVRNASATLSGDAAERYKAVQSGEKVSVGAVAGAPTAAARNDDDDDDGSGMAWVRRRREQRERERKEKEEKERLEREEEERKRAEETAADTTEAKAGAEGETSEVAGAEKAQDVQPEAVGESIQEGLVLPSPPAAVAAAAAAALATPVSGSPPVVDEEHHIVKAVTVPVVQSSETSLSMHGSSSASSSSSSSSSSSDEDSEDEEGREDEEESDTDEEEVDEKDEKRKTSLCAGVEKVSRHKETGLPISPPASMPMSPSASS